MSERGTDWAVFGGEDVVLWIFPAEMDPAAFEADPLWQQWQRVCGRERFSRVLVVLEVDAPFSGTVFQYWERGAAAAERAGVARLAIVAPTTKAMSMRNHLDTDGLDLYTTQQLSDALAWIRR